MAPAAAESVDLAGSRAGTVVEGQSDVADDHNGGGTVHADVPLDLGYATTCISRVASAISPVSTMRICTDADT